METPDLQFCNLGSFAGVRAVSDAGAEWLAENLAEDAMEYGSHVLIDIRCLDDIVIGAREDGLVCHG